MGRRSGFGSDAVKAISSGSDKKAGADHGQDALDTILDVGEETAKRATREFSHASGGSDPSINYKAMMVKLGTLALLDLQPRFEDAYEADDETMQVLMASIRERTVLEPVLIQEHFDENDPEKEWLLKAGRRRYTAVKLIAMQDSDDPEGWKEATIPAYITPIKAIEDCEDDSIAENDVRSGLTMIERGIWLVRRMANIKKAKGKVNVSDLCRRSGMDRQSFYVIKDLMPLIEPFAGDMDALILMKAIQRDDWRRLQKILKDKGAKEATAILLKLIGKGGNEDEPKKPQTLAPTKKLAMEYGAATVKADPVHGRHKLMIEIKDLDRMDELLAKAATSLRELVEKGEA